MSTVYIIKVGEDEGLVNKIRNNSKFTFDGIYNFVKDIKIGDKVYIYFGGGKGVKWERGLAGYGVFASEPYDLNYSGKNYRIDIQPQVILQSPISAKETKLHPEYQDLFYENAPFIGAEHPANQAILSISDDATIKAIELIINKKKLAETQTFSDLDPDDIKNAFQSICEFCENYPNIKGGLPSSDPRALEAKNNLEVIASWMQGKFSNFKGYEIKVSISKGSGAFPTVPWIVLLPPGQKITKGIYVALCFGNEGAGAILGCAESSSYPMGLKTVTRTERGSTPDINVDGRSVGTKYNNVYANPIEIRKGAFDAVKFLNHTEDSLKMALKFVSTEEPPIVEIPFKVEPDFSSAANLNYTSNLVSRYKALLLTKPFLILTGLSGSGKTKIAEAFATWICSNSDEQVLLVPVGADWTNRDPLLGYFDGINKKYRKDDYGIINLLLSAEQDPDQPYFLILDEMNLSHVERYFADFLSLMESSKKTLKLYDGIIETSESIDNEDAVPPIIELPKNLFVIGTVNIDETTYMFSPKVLDRAGVIEFRVDESEMQTFLDNPIKPNLDSIAGLGASMAADFVRIATKDAGKYAKQDDLNKELIKFFRELKKVGAEFGYRTAFEINRFAGIVNSIVPVGEEWSVEQITDAAIIQKLLPKLHGSQRKLSGVLKTLAGLCLKDALLAEKMLDSEYDLLSTDQVTSVKYPLSFEKIHRMYQRAKKDGFTSFAEA